MTRDEATALLHQWLHARDVAADLFHQRGYQLAVDKAVRLREQIVDAMTSEAPSAGPFPHRVLQQGKAGE